mmetsp:Transcript_31561/g.36459  ORF Transcript_31561/g.36459 Transcript_31561/m.36459 type:complete len:135 (+) Transcript_31561:39-443(+)
MLLPPLASLHFLSSRLSSFRRPPHQSLHLLHIPEQPFLMQFQRQGNKRFLNLHGNILNRLKKGLIKTIANTRTGCSPNSLNGRINAKGSSQGQIHRNRTAQRVYPSSIGVRRSFSQLIKAFVSCTDPSSITICS